ncbi:MAG: biotin/lipoyl-binding protein [Pseudomonadota bacterium]
MFELLFCSALTIFPDYLYRRYAQGKRIGQEITLFSVWYELRWGISACFLLTVSLIAVIFYFHPSTTNVTSFFRTVTILPESSGRVTEVFVRNGQTVAAGDMLFTLDDTAERAAVVTAQQAVAEVEAAVAVAQFELETAKGQVREADGRLEQAIDELDLKRDLVARNSDVVSERELRQLENIVASRQGGVDAALANQHAVETHISTLLPAQRATAEAALEQAEVALDKTSVSALIDGRVEQFALQPGDIVSPVLRPAGILIPTAVVRGRFQAGFGQLATQVIEPGMVAEIACLSLPFTVVPMVITDLQEVIPAGQFRPSDQLVELADRAQTGTVVATLEPLYAGGTDAIPPGSKCVANAYTNNHDRLAEGGLSLGTWLFLHMVDTVGLVHALLLRVQALFLPIQVLVFSAH